MLLSCILLEGGFPFVSLEQWMGVMVFLIENILLNKILFCSTVINYGLFKLQSWQDFPLLPTANNYLLLALIADIFVLRLYVSPNFTWHKSLLQLPVLHHTHLFLNSVHFYSCVAKECFVQNKKVSNERL